MELTVILGDVGFKSQLKIYIILKQILSVCSHRHLPIWFLQTNTELFFFGWWRWGRGTLLPLADSFYRIILQMQSCVRGVGVNQLNNPSVPAWESNNRCVVVSDCVIARSRWCPGGAEDELIGRLRLLLLLKKASCFWNSFHNNSWRFYLWSWSQGAEPNSAPGAWADLKRFGSARPWFLTIFFKRWRSLLKNSVTETGSFG